MKPTAYMPFYGNDFFTAVEGKSDAFVVAYMRAIWFFWSNSHCRPIKNDDETLRKICRVDKSDWPDLRDQIFDDDRFFIRNGDRDEWVQARAEFEWSKSSAAYGRAVKGGKARAQNLTKEERSRIATMGAVARYKNRLLA